MVFQLLAAFRQSCIVCERWPSMMEYACHIASVHCTIQSEYLLSDSFQISTIVMPAVLGGGVAAGSTSTSNASVSGSITVRKSPTPLYVLVICSAISQVIVTKTSTPDWPPRSLHLQLQVYDLAFKLCPSGLWAILAVVAMTQHVVIISLTHCIIVGCWQCLQLFRVAPDA